MPVCSLTIRSIRVRGKPQTLARTPADILSGTRNSSRRTSPGCMGLSFLVITAPLLVVVHDLDLRRADIKRRVSTDDTADPSAVRTVDLKIIPIDTLYSYHVPAMFTPSCPPRGRHH